MHNNSNPILVKKNSQAQANLNYDLLAEKTSDNGAQGVVEVQNNLVNIKTMVENQTIPTDNVAIDIATVEFDPNVKEKSSVAIGIKREFEKVLGGTRGSVEKQGHASTLETIETSQSIVVKDNQIVTKIDFFDIYSASAAVSLAI
ncbi:hypothetical protein RDI58_007472 [Solanum bulbocastanum]|uniref:Uncharacterized protein n=1 Tax=Solanum bulbocastanum TaxID=147425 RepID=A0AAN8YHQ9_SOLBU